MKKFLGYSISESGEVISRFGRQIKQHTSSAGYARVELWSGGFGRKYSVHRLVADLYIPNPEGKPQVNHKDGDKLNNDKSNLEWCTRSENQLHAYRNGLQKGYKKPTPLSEEHKKALCGSRWKGETRVYEAEGITFDCPQKAADHFGLNRQTFYNRANSERFKSWKITVLREEK